MQYKGRWEGGGIGGNIGGREIGNGTRKNDL